MVIVNKQILIYIHFDDVLHRTLFFALLFFETKK